MTPEQINRAIAESVGWKWFDHPDVQEKTKTFTLADKWVMNQSGKLVFPHDCPNYHGDLNAIQAAIMQHVNKPPSQYLKAEMEFTIESNLPFKHWRRSALMLPAADWCEAYLRTIGKWEGA